MVAAAVLELVEAAAQEAAMAVTPVVAPHLDSHSMVVLAALFKQIDQMAEEAVVAPEVMFIVAVAEEVLELLVTHKVDMEVKVVRAIPNFLVAIKATAAATMAVAVVADQVVTMVVEQEVHGQMILLTQEVGVLRLLLERHNFNIIIKQTHLLGGFFIFCLIINRR
jgi:hypothetical protein